MKNKDYFCIYKLLLLIFTVLLLVSCSEEDSNTTNTTQSTTQTLPIEEHTHVWSEWTTEIKANCSTKGLKIRTCECGARDEIHYAALGHNLGDWVVVLPSQCELSGKEERTCNNCDYKETKSLPALVHTEGEWIIKNNNKYFLCIYCNQILRTETISVSENLEIIHGAVLGMGECSDTNVVIPMNTDGGMVSIIGVKSFMNQKITSIIIPDSIITIQENAFYKCFQLETVHLGNGIIEIEAKVFYNCTSLNNISLPNSLEFLGEYAFAYCSNLKTIYIENSLEKLPVGVFYECKSLTDIYFNGTLDEWNSLTKDLYWDYGMPNYTIHCIDGDIEK